MRGNKKAICKYRLQSLVVMHCHCQVAPYLGRGARTGRMQRGGKDPGANCISYLKLSAAFALKSLTLSQTNCAPERKRISPASYASSGNTLARKRKPRRRLTAGRTPAGDAYGIPGIMVSAGVESPPRPECTIPSPWKLIMAQATANAILNEMSNPGECLANQ